MLVILATQEAEIQRIRIQGQIMQKVCKTPSQSIKAEGGGLILSSHLCSKQKDGSPGWPGHKCESPYLKIQQEEMVAWLKL
jgi:hypothetical protein